MGNKLKNWKVKLSRTVVSDSSRPHGLETARLLCPRDSLGRNTGVGGHFLLQGILPTQGSNPGLLYCRRILYRLSHQGSPFIPTHINVYTTEDTELASWIHQWLLVWSFPLHVLIITSPLWGHQNWMSACRHLFGDAVASREGEKVHAEPRACWET